MAAVTENPYGLPGDIYDSLQPVAGSADGPGDPFGTAGSSAEGDAPSPASCTAPCCHPGIYAPYSPWDAVHEVLRKPELEERQRMELEQEARFPDYGTARGVHTIRQWGSAWRSWRWEYLAGHAEATDRKAVAWRLAVRSSPYLLFLDYGAWSHAYDDSLKHEEDPCQ